MFCPQCGKEYSQKVNFCCHCGSAMFTPARPANRKLTLSRRDKKIAGVCGGFAEYLDASMDPRVARIALTEARAVLGWEEWRRIETENGYAMTFAMLEAAIQAGEIPAQPAGPLAHLLLGAANEAAFLIAGADDPSRTRAEMGEALDRLMRSLASP